MSETFGWCKDKTRLGILDKHIFCIDRYGTKAWYLNGELHRVNGPAVELARGDKYWLLNGKYHRVEGPAIEYADGTDENGKYHRVDGPAIEYATGYSGWFLHGIRYYESDYWNELKK